MDDLIWREDVIKAVNELTYPSSLTDVKRKLIAIPAVEREHGEWISVTVKGDEYFSCSVCREILEHPYEQHDFCPNCGADMRNKHTEIKPDPDCGWK